MAKKAGASGGDLGSGVESGVGAEVALAVDSGAGPAVGSALACDVGSGVGSTAGWVVTPAAGLGVESGVEAQKSARLRVLKFARRQVQRLTLLPSPAWWVQVTGVWFKCTRGFYRKFSCRIGSTGRSAVG